MSGQWNLAKKIVWNTPNLGATQKDTTLGLPQEYVDFRNDGKEYISFWKGTNYQYDTLKYSVSGNILHTSKGNINGTSDIPTLTSNSLTIHTSTIDSFRSSDYWFFYSK